MPCKQKMPVSVFYLHLCRDRTLQTVINGSPELQTEAKNLCFDPKMIENLSWVLQTPEERDRNPKKMAKTTKPPKEEQQTKTIQKVQNPFHKTNT